MSLIITLVVAIAAGVSGIIIGWFLRFITALGRKGSIELEIKEMLITARQEAERISSEAEGRVRAVEQEAKKEAKESQAKLDEKEDRLVKKEELLDKRQIDLDKEEGELKNENKRINEKEQELEEVLEEKRESLKKITTLSEDEARKELVELLEKKYEEDLTVQMQKLEKVGREQLDKKAKEILINSIQRFGNSVASDTFSTVVNLSDEKIKGRIIGKEGRNIKSFEKETGVELIVDDTPETITISSFDPIRRAIAAHALKELMSDGRIQPAKIEKAVAKAKEDVNKIIKQKGEEAAYECHVFNLDPRILLILGRLHFRTSYGQNALQHTIEVAQIARMIAEEVGADPTVAAAGALVHDIGKAVDHEVQGSHVEIGRKILQKFGADEAIIKAMQAHHEEYPYETLESVIVQVADSISGSRPGARQDSIENYLKRLTDLEAIPNAMPAVKKAYALQAGREIRVFVHPEKVTDLEANNLARDIAKQIESELKYPGEIKVTLVRETKITEFAR